VTIDISAKVSQLRPAQAALPPWWPAHPLAMEILFSQPPVRFNSMHQRIISNLSTL
jgi:hypothetical protein